MATSKPRANAIDFDATTKEMVTALFKYFIQLANPALYAAVDWSYPPVSLEQEADKYTQRQIQNKRQAQK